MSNPHYEQTGWSLEELFPGFDHPKTEQAITELKEQVADFVQVRSQLTPDIDPDAFRQILDQYAAMYSLGSRLGGYAMLSFSEDTQDQQALGFMARMQQMGAELENQSMFFKLWWKELSDEAAQPLLDAAGDYGYWLETLRLERPYTLSEAEEKIINLKNVNGPAALMTLYDSITNRYLFNITVNGQSKEVTRPELQVYFRDPNPDARAAAYQELNRVYSEDATILGQIYQYRVRDWRSEQIELRRFESPIAVRNLYNDIPGEVVDVLLQVCQENAPLFHRYFQLKARCLGMERLRRYDLYAPVTQNETTYGFDEAVTLVLDAIRPFDPAIEKQARRVFDERHIDSEVRKGKRSGAFCATITPELTPWILQSYQGRPDDVATMAHELGHAIHSMLAEHHTILTQHPCLPLAETASTFTEMLLIDHLLAQDPDPAVRQDLLFRQMDDAYATIMRQAYFALFERDAHEQIRQGASVDRLSQLYLANLTEQFGDSMALSDDFRHEWLAIPHIYMTPFYVYAYSFGQLLVLALYRQYLEEGDAFKPRYKEILAAGGSDAPVRILKRAGIDVYEPAFWQGGFDIVASLLEQLEETVNN